MQEEKKTAYIPVQPPTPGPAAMPLSWRFALAAAVLVVSFAAYFLQWQNLIGPRGQAAAGVLCFLGIVAALSANLRAVNWRTILWGFVLQIVLALLVIKGPGYAFFDAIGLVVKKFLEFTNAGSQFVFGNLANREAMNKLFPPDKGFIFAFSGLPTVIFVASFFTVLYYFGVLRFIVHLIAKVMMYLMQTSGAETLSVTANIFMGQTEAPLIIKPYVPQMTQSELLTLMVGGMAHVSGGIMAVYIDLGADPVAILATSVMASPCTLYLTKLFLPETQVPQTRGGARTVVEQQYVNAIDAAASGAADGMRLVLNIAAMLIAFLAFIALFNAVLKIIPAEPQLSLERIFSWIFAPVAFLVGVEGADIPKVADLLGTKLVANELVAYVKLHDYVHLADHPLSPRARVLASYALTGFANFASIGIQLGGIGAIAPSRRQDLARFGLRALFVGFLVTLINASLAGMLLELPEASAP
jgi:concentrative nucleoside transporter, CNT family